MIAGKYNFFWSDNMTRAKAVNITVRVEPKTKEILNLICAVKDISINEYINNLIEEKTSQIDDATIKQMENLKEL